MPYMLQIINGVDSFRYTRKHILLKMCAFVHWVWKFNG